MSTKSKLAASFAAILLCGSLSTAHATPQYIEKIGKKEAQITGLILLFCYYGIKELEAIKDTRIEDFRKPMPLAKADFPVLDRNRVLTDAARRGASIVGFYRVFWDSGMWPFNKEHTAVIQVMGNERLQNFTRIVHTTDESFNKGCATHNRWGELPR